LHRARGRFSQLSANSSCESRAERVWPGNSGITPLGRVCGLQPTAHRITSRERGTLDAVNRHRRAGEDPARFGGGWLPMPRLRSSRIRTPRRPSVGDVRQLREPGARADRRLATPTPADHRRRGSPPHQDVAPAVPDAGGRVGRPPAVGSSRSPGGVPALPEYTSGGPLAQLVERRTSFDGALVGKPPVRRQLFAGTPLEPEVPKR
jgi:hypothetical protein